MASKRDLKLDQYDIGKYAYRELHNFCLQYPHKKTQLAELRNPYNSPEFSGMPHASGTSDPTANNAERAAILSQECELIEQTAVEASGDDYQFIIWATTEDVTWYTLKLLKDLKTPRDKFDNERRLFYYLLAKKRKII